MTTEVLTQVFGFLASLITFILWVPQSTHTWKNRNKPEVLKGISLGTQWLMITSSIFWLGYAILAPAYWSGAPCLINIPLAAITIFLIHRSRKQNLRSTISVLLNENA